MLPTSIPPPLILALGVGLLFSWAWFRQRRTRNAGLVDLCWTGSLPAAAAVYALTSGGWVGRRGLVALLAIAWGGRLLVHLWARYRSEPEDGRYAALRREHGDGFDRWLIPFFAAQAVLAWLLSLAFWVPMQDVRTGFRALDLVAISVCVVSVLGESIADRQLMRHRRDPNQKGRTCRSGLWAWSRHPNYFFEWLGWFVWPLLSVGVEHGAWLWIVPVAMGLLIVKVTGIPPTEARALESRGDDYRRYQREVSAFFPLPPSSGPRQVTP